MPEFGDKFTSTEPLRIIDSETIVDVPVSSETKMLLPDQSLAQELLAENIPLANRIAHLIPYIEPLAELFTASTISKKIGADVEWVRRVATRIGVEPSVGNDGTMYYPPTTLELLEEEWQWYVSYEQLNDELSAYAIGRYMAKDVRWVMGKAYELGVYPHGNEIKRGEYKPRYPKTLIPQLRHLILLFLPAQDYLTVYELSQQFSKSWEWVQKRLENNGLLPEKRWSLHTSELVNHYPPESEQIIARAVNEIPPPAGEWLTVRAIAKKLSKTHHWVKGQIQGSVIDGELRLDDRGAVVMHYSPEVVSSLEEDAQKINTYPNAGEYLALKALAKTLGRSTYWVKKRLAFTNIESEIRADLNKKLHTYYPPDAVDILEALPQDILKQAGATQNPSE